MLQGVRYQKSLPYILYDARDATILWPPEDLTRKEASLLNHQLALNGRTEIWILRDSLTLHILSSGVRTGTV